MLDLALALTLMSAPADTVHCVQAARFLSGTQRMQAVVEPDSMNDWRSQRRVGSCRITAAGGTLLTVQGEATRLYERLRDAQWARTPDPRDSPREGSLRFRWQQSDCLFNVNTEALLFTDAETEVIERRTLAPNERPYYVFVMCTAAVDAAPR
jgi:hypothetical protein